MNKIIFLATLLLFNALSGSGQDAKIKIPAFKDKYSKYVEQLESGQLDIDYADFRNSYLDSKQYHNSKSDLYDLQKKVYAEIKNKNYNAVIDLTSAMLNIDYTSMFAHKYRGQTYKILGDSANWHKYHDIEFGLLNSIIHSGDGKTCETGWHVIQIEEEYFILNMLGVEFESQSIITSKHNFCDRMTVKTDDGEKDYYFEANKVFEMEEKMFGK